MAAEQPSAASRSRVTDLGGIFYPVGYLVAAFPEKALAEQARNALRTGGYEDSDWLFYDSEEVAVAAQKNLDQNDSWLSLLGKSDEAVRMHLSSAKRGASFLLIFAPNDIDARRAMNVIRRGPFKFVHRYHRLAIEELK